jgi:hypothetical protein
VWPDNGIPGGVENTYEAGNFSDAKSDGEEVENTTGIKYDYCDKTWN